MKMDEKSVEKKTINASLMWIDFNRLIIIGEYMQACLCNERVRVRTERIYKFGLKKKKTNTWV